MKIKKDSCPLHVRLVYWWITTKTVWTDRAKWDDDGNFVSLMEGRGVEKFELKKTEYGTVLVVFVKM